MDVKEKCCVGKRKTFGYNDKYNGSSGSAGVKAGVDGGVEAGVEVTWKWVFDKCPQ